MTGRLIIINLTLLVLFLIPSCSLNSNEKDKHKHIEVLPINNSLKLEVKDTMRYSVDLSLKRVINAELIEKVQVFGNPEEAESFIKYLGEIKIGKEKYFVLSKFTIIQLAISKRGRSVVLFLDKNKEVIKKNNLDMPDQLPYKIEENKLVFYFDNKDYIMQLEDSLLGVFCLPNYKGCYYPE